MPKRDEEWADTQPTHATADVLADAPTETSTLVVEHASPAAVGPPPAPPAVAEPPPPAPQIIEPPPPPPAAVLEARIAAMRQVAQPAPKDDFAVGFEPWAATSAQAAGVLASRPLEAPPTFLVRVDAAKTDDLRKVLATLTGQTKTKNITIESLVGAIAADSILRSLSVRRATTAAVAFSKRAQQVATAHPVEPVICLLRLERDHRLLEARVTIRQPVRTNTSGIAVVELAATAPVAMPEDLKAFDDLRAALASIWGETKPT